MYKRQLLNRAGEQLRAVLPGASRLFVVTDSHVGPIYLEQLEEQIKGAGFCVSTCTVPAGESSKSPEQLAVLWEQMMAAGLTRSDAVEMCIRDRLYHDRIPVINRRFFGK